MCCASLCLALGACGNSAGSGGAPGALSLSLSSATALALQDGTPAKITATVTGNSGPVTLAVRGVPSGTLSPVAEPGSNGSGAIMLTSSAGTPAGAYALQVTATDLGSTASQNLTMVVAVAGAVLSTVDRTQGVNGKLQQFMSTSFQPAEWDYPYFPNHTASEPAQLDHLGTQHIRLQGLSQAVPMRSNTGAASDWDFSKLDAVVQPVLSVGDHSPEFEIAVAPAFYVHRRGHLRYHQRIFRTTVRTWCATTTDRGSTGEGSTSSRQVLSPRVRTKSPGGASSTNTTSTA